VKSLPYIKKAIWSLIVVLCFPAISLAAETYCQHQSVRVYDGAETEVDWTVVIGSARKAQKVGQSKPTTGCSSSWQSLGPFFRPIEILKNTKIGEAKISPRYRIFFKPTKLGRDELIVRIHWVQGTTTKQASAIVKYRLNVIGRPI
jgi:hypothetical protein